MFSYLHGSNYGLHSLLYRIAESASDGRLSTPNDIFAQGWSNKIIELFCGPTRCHIYPNYGE